MISAGVLAGVCVVHLGVRSAASRWGWKRVGMTTAVLAATAVWVHLVLLVDAPSQRAFYVTAKWLLVLTLVFSAPLAPALLYLSIRWALMRRRLQALAASAWLTATVSAGLAVFQARSA
jgi:hypothetical protein